ncbi:hypothetical protein SAMN04515667_0791 [Formosa sp. Hel1_31_208]|nr:hypothetical protein SAMN04515667_0791 [Formosa sp. Hel1_31_208]
MKQFDDLLQYLGLFLIVLNALLYTRSYIIVKKNVALLFLSLYLFVSGIVMVFSSILAYNSEPNLHLSHIYFIAQFVFLSLFFGSLFNSKQKKWVTLILIFVLTVLICQYIQNPELIYKFNLFEIFITSFPIIIYSIIHLYNSLSKNGEYMLVNSGILVYLTTSTLIFILGNYLAEFRNDLITKIWIINKLLYVLYLVLILIEWKIKFQPAKSS